MYLALYYPSSVKTNPQANHLDGIWTHDLNNAGTYWEYSAYFNKHCIGVQVNTNYILDAKLASIRWMYTYNR